jgi:hypothetical protein
MLVLAHDGPSHNLRMEQVMTRNGYYGVGGVIVVVIIVLIFLKVFHVI